MRLVSVVLFLCWSRFRMVVDLVMCGLGVVVVLLCLGVGVVVEWVVCWGMGMVFV